MVYKTYLNNDMFYILIFFEKRMLMNIAICDDDKSFRDLLEKHLRNYFNDRNISLNIFQFPSGEKLLENQLLFDLVFLDVEMGNINGIDTGKELKRRNPHNIIFVITSYDGYLDDAFHIRAFRFLSKPLDIVRLYRALDDAAELINNDIIVFYDVKSSSNVRIYTNDIIYLEIEKKKTKIVTVDNIYYSNEKISVWKNRLNAISFVCPHSSYVANLDYSVYHTRTLLVLAKRDLDGKIIEKYEINIAPKKQAEIKRLFFYVLEIIDSFRNPKLSAAVYASQKTPRSPSDIVLEVSSSMALGDHPGGFAGACWVFTNAESVRLYRGNDFIAEFSPDRRGRFAALPHPPIEVQDFVGSLLEKYEGLDPVVAPQVAAILNEMRRDALSLSPLSRARLLSLRLSWNDLLRMYYKYIGVLGSPSSVYRFEAVWHGRTVRTVVREPVQSVRLECTVYNPLLTDGPTWDCAAVSLRAIDQNGNFLPYCGEAVQLSVEGPVRILGPSVVPLRGGMAGTYLATTGRAGRAVLHCKMEGALDTEAVLTVRKRS